MFTPKYRRKVIYNQYRSSLGEIFYRLCSYNGIEIIEGYLMPDYVHMLVSISPRISVASFVGYLKGKNTLMMFYKHANLKYKFGNRHFWAEGYYVTFSPFRSVCCETKKPPAMRVRVEGYTKKTPNAIQ